MLVVSALYRDGGYLAAIARKRHELDHESVGSLVDFHVLDDLWDDSFNGLSRYGSLTTYQSGGGFQTASHSQVVWGKHQWVDCVNHVLDPFFGHYHGRADNVDEVSEAASNFTVNQFGVADQEGRTFEDVSTVYKFFGDGF